MIDIERACPAVTASLSGRAFDFHDCAKKNP
jgi:hypothetical protein